MEENNTNQKELSLVVWLGILAGLVIGVILIFAMLEVAIPKQEILLQPENTVVEKEPEHPAPSFCPDCGQGLPETFDWGQYCPYCGQQAVWTA